MPAGPVPAAPAAPPASPVQAPPAQGDDAAFGDQLAATRSAGGNHDDPEAPVGNADKRAAPRKEDDTDSAAAAPPSILLALLAPMPSSAEPQAATAMRPSKMARQDARPAAGTNLPAVGKALPAEAATVADAQALAAVAAHAGGLAERAHGDAGKLLLAKNEHELSPPVQQPVISAASGPANGAVALLNASPPPSPPPQLPALQQPLGTPAWQADFSEQVVWLAKHDVQAARLHLNPRHLGPIEVHIQLAQNQAQVWFHADHPATRAAMQASLPQLQQMFDQQGLGLAGAHVATQDPGARHGDRTPHRQTFASAVGGVDGPGIANGSPVMSVVAAGLIDAYA